jgi:hypothetical protein
MTFAERYGPNTPMYRDGLPTEELRSYVDSYLATASAVALDSAPAAAPESEPVETELVTWQVPTWVGLLCRPKTFTEGDKHQ